MAQEVRMGPKRIRHWKQRFATDYDFIWRRRATLGDGVVAQPGDTVDKTMFTRRKLRALWDANRIEIKDWVKPAEAQRRQPVVEARGQGWYHVLWRGEKHRIRGREAVDEFVANAKAQIESEEAA